ncbi:hypothetical protein [Undibacterium flavidum]|uniref:Uncharacterized protein n=1 Tax=Undibacterium flavidum TaxID=2762297 RepID=A0ABR6YHH1_9BURK|nr:hypothetical protein [Undibacterium flavidum]MBC3876035.1 hypothetical protein [Undibacterium flavidum]
MSLASFGGKYFIQRVVEKLGLNMFIVWGKKHVYRKIGFVADFCPMCRSIKGFLLRRVGLAGHIYYISVGEGDLIGYERTCENCQTTFNADANKYASFCKKTTSLNDLQRQTYPALTTDIAERLELEEKIRNTPNLFSRSERQDLIFLPFALLAPKVERQYANIQIDKETGFSMLGVIIFFMIIPGFVQNNFPQYAEESLLFFVALSVILLAWQFLTAGRRFMRKQIIPVLARALVPLRPTEAEIRLTLEDMKKQKQKIGVKLKINDLMEHLKTIKIANTI